MDTLAYEIADCANKIIKANDKEFSNMYVFPPDDVDDFNQLEILVRENLESHLDKDLIQYAEPSEYWLESIILQFTYKNRTIQIGERINRDRYWYISAMDVCDI